MADVDTAAIGRMDNAWHRLESVNAGTCHGCGAPIGRGRPDAVLFGAAFRAGDELDDAYGMSDRQAARFGSMLTDVD